MGFEPTTSSLGRLRTHHGACRPRLPESLTGWEFTHTDMAGQCQPDARDPRRYLSVVGAFVRREGAGCEMSVAENNSSNSRIHILT